MLIKSPIGDKIKFIIPEVIDLVDKTVEPTLEDITGEDAVQDTINDGDVIVGATDGIPFVRPRINTDSSTAVWRVDTALERRPRRGLNGVLMANHNLLDVYDTAIRSAVEFYSNTSDALPTNPIEISNHLSRILGEGAAYGSFDGVDDLVTVADDPAIQNIFSGGGSLVGWIYPFTDGEGNLGYIISKGVVGASGWRIAVRDSDGTKVILSMFKHFTGVDGQWNSTNPEVPLNEWSHFAVTYNDSDVSNDATLYVKGLSVAVTEVGIPTGTAESDDTFDMIIGNRANGAQTFDGGIRKLIPYNRILAPKEIEQMALGVPVPNPLIIGDNSSMNSVGDYVAGGAATVTGGYDSGDSGHETTLRIQAGDTSGEYAVITLPSGLRIGGNYKLEGNYKHINVDGIPSNGTSMLLTGGTLQTLDNVALSLGAWADYEDTFVATSDNDEIRLYCQQFGDTASADNEMLWDNLYLTDLDTLVTFPLVADQWGEQGLLVDTMIADNTGDWTKVDCTLVDVGANGYEMTRVADTQAIYQAITPLTVGERYRITCEYREGTGTGHTLSFRVVTGSWFNAPDNSSNVVTAAGLQTINFEFTAAGASDKFVLASFMTGAGDSAVLLNFSLDRLGAVAAYQHDGLSISQGLWLDASRNGLHGAINGVDIWNAPETNKYAYSLWEFASPVADRYLFDNFNPNGLTGLDDTRFGWIAWISLYAWDYVEESGVPGTINGDGIIADITEGGVVFAEKRFGLNPSWTITLITQGVVGWQEAQDMVEKLKLRLYPFYIILDSASSEVALWQVRINEDVGFSYVQGSEDDGTTWEGIRFVIQSEGRK